MLKPLLHTYAVNLNYAKMLVKDVPDTQMAVEPVAGRAMNHAAWVLGHLAVSSGFVAGLVGAQSPAPESWEKLFGFGSKPEADVKRYPAKAELLKVLEEAHQRVAAAVAKVPEARWAEPFPLEEMRGFVPTLGDGIVFLLSAHEATHLGQLSAWRRAQGLPSVM